MTESRSESPQSKPEMPHRAGAFDIRVFIASLIGLYGVVLVIVGLFGTDDTQLDKSDGMNINLFAGAAMVVFAVSFMVWARLRPVVVPPELHTDDDPADRPGH